MKLIIKNLRNIILNIFSLPEALSEHILNAKDFKHNSNDQDYELPNIRMLCSYDHVCMHRELQDQAVHEFRHFFLCLN